ncbi:Unknown protein, partial [Striga hermonthica]
FKLSHHLPVSTITSNGDSPERSLRVPHLHPYWPSQLQIEHVSAMAGADHFFGSPRHGWSWTCCRPATTIDSHRRFYCRRRYGLSLRSLRRSRMLPADLHCSGGRCPASPVYVAIEGVVVVATDAVVQNPVRH